MSDYTADVAREDRDVLSALADSLKDPAVMFQELSKEEMLNTLRLSVATAQAMSDQVEEITRELDRINVLVSAAEAREKTSSDLLEGVADALREDVPVGSYHALPKLVRDLVQRNQWQAGCIAFYRQLHGSSDTSAATEQMARYQAQERELQRAQADLAALQDEYGQTVTQFLLHDDQQDAQIQSLTVRNENLEKELQLVKAQAFDLLYGVKDRL
jgi:hypothetical protein